MKFSRMAGLPTFTRKRSLNARAAASAAFAVLALCSCASYQTKVSGARDWMKRDNPAEAIKALEPLANKEGDDQLVYLLDYASALQQNGQYKESASALNRAGKIADIQDYHSLTKVASSLLLSEEMVQYKGDDYEKVLINAINAINYLELGDQDEALVEVRLLNEKLLKFKNDAKRDYQQNPFAFYLAALIYESNQKWDDAYISFKSAYDVAPGYVPLHEDLVRAAIRAQRPEDVEKWTKLFPEVRIRPEWKDRAMGELVVIFSQGWGPRKAPRPEAPRFPHLVPTSSQVKTARITALPAGAEAAPTERNATSSKIFSVQDVAIKTLNDDYARLVASRVGGVAVKAVVADQIAQKNKLLGAVAWIALNATDRADVRQWSTLPESFQFARLPIKAGKYKVSITGLDSSGNATADRLAEREVTVPAGRKTFLSWRSVR
jgi:hypothetical protein